MKSPGVEWVLGIGYLAAVDLIRAKGEADNDTLSECLREVVERVPHGRALFAVAVVAGAIGFHRHIVGPIKQPS